MGKGEDDDVVTDEGVDLGGLDETLGQVDEVGVVLSEEGACGGAAVRAPISISGWALRRRRTSPPA